MTDKQRIKMTDICMSDSMPFQQHWEARTTWPLVEALTEEFFLPVRNMLRPGDAITLCRYDKNDPYHRDVKLLEVATVRVIASSADAKAVPLALVGEIARLAGAAPERQLHVARGQAGKFKIMEGETVVEEFGSKVEADDALKKLAA